MGPDDIPAEYWQSMILDQSGLNWLTDLCNQYLLEQSVPSCWQEANVKTIYKKGIVEDCGNYRPISLLSAAYKLLAGLLLKRLREAGAEDRLTKSQLGFRKGRGTMQCSQREDL